MLLSQNPVCMALMPLCSVFWSIYSSRRVREGECGGLHTGSESRTIPQGSLPPQPLKAGRGHTTRLLTLQSPLHIPGRGCGSGWRLRSWRTVLRTLDLRWPYVTMSYNLAHNLVHSCALHLI